MVFLARRLAGHRYGLVTEPTEPDLWEPHARFLQEEGLLGWAQFGPHLRSLPSSIWCENPSSSSDTPAGWLSAGCEGSVPLHAHLFLFSLVPSGPVG